MIRYYPLTRIKSNLYTRGNEYRLPNGNPYTGRYYLTFDGEAYTGVNPIVGTNELLTKFNPTSSPTINFPGPSLEYARGLSGDQNVLSQNLTLNLEELKPYFPIPVEEDYQRGYFNRYFAKNLIGQVKIIEVSETTYSDIENGIISQEFVRYETMSMLWQLTGPENDVRVSQYQVRAGVATTNKRVTLGKESTFTGIVNYIGGEYTKFARITP